jgi:YHS domain-containing protein
MPIDPVCKKHVDVSTAAASYDYHSWTVYFDSIECLKLFERDPDAYIHRLDDDQLTAA